MFAAIDLGSNSFRLHIGQYDGTSMCIIKSARHQVNLAAGLDASGCLTEEAIRAALACLSEFNALLTTFPGIEVRIVATNTLRIAHNADYFIPLAEQAIGYPIDVISGEEEGRLIYLGVAHSVPFSEQQTALVVDIGGGSTEIILGHHHAIREVASLSIGTHTQYTSYFEDGVMSAAAFDAAITTARSYFEEVSAQYDCHAVSEVYGSSGTIRAIGTILAKNQFGDGTLSYANLLALKERLIGIGHVQKIDFDGVKPERKSLIAGGLSILIGIYQEFTLSSMQTTVAGLRMGVLWDLHFRSRHQDRRDDAITGLMRKFQVDSARAYAVASLSTAFFKQLAPVQETHQKCLYWASLLHEVGLYLSHSNVHKHSAYIVGNADIAGFGKYEQGLMSTFILGQKGNLKKVEKALADTGVMKAIVAMRLATMFLHGKIDKGAEHLHIRITDHIALEIDADFLAAHPTLSYWLQKEKEHWSNMRITLHVDTR